MARAKLNYHLKDENSTGLDVIPANTNVIVDSYLGKPTSMYWKGNINGGVDVTIGEAILNKDLSLIVPRTASSSFRNLIPNGDFKIWQRLDHKFELDDSTDGDTGVALTVGAVDEEYHCRVADSVVSTCENIEIETKRTKMLGSRSFKVIPNSNNLNVDTFKLRPYRVGIEERDLMLALTQSNIVTLSFNFKASVSGVYPICITYYDDNNINTYITSFTYDVNNDIEEIVKTIQLGPYADDGSGYTTYVEPNIEGVTMKLSVDIGYYLNTDSGDVATAEETEVWSLDPIRDVENQVNWIGDGTNGDFIELSRVQLTPGEDAKEFDIIPHDIELLRCQRYFEVIESTSLDDGYDDGNDILSLFPYVALKRSIPTVSFIEKDNNNTTTYEINPATIHGKSDDWPIVASRRATLIVLTNPDGDDRWTILSFKAYASSNLF